MCDRGAFAINQKKDRGMVAKYKYYHIIKNMNVTDDPLRLSDILKAAFSDLAMKCLVTSAPQEASPVERWLRDLRSISNLHFDTSTESSGIDIGSDAVRHDRRIRYT